jgi:hypothetical protein
MRPLLSAALLVTGAIAADLLPAVDRLIAMRRLADRVAPDPADGPADRVPHAGRPRSNSWNGYWPP